MEDGSPVRKEEERVSEVSNESSIERPEILAVKEEVKEIVSEISPIVTVENPLESVKEPEINKDIIKIRAEKLFQRIRKSPQTLFYLILAVIVYIGIFIRTRNIPRLKDITTGEWTLGPDLDPFLFLRWAEYIAENGKLFVNDAFRNVPLGFNTAGESKLLSQMIAWFFHGLNSLPTAMINLLPGNPSEITVMYAALLFPVFMFALTVIAFFFLTKEIFKDVFDNEIYPGIIALIASFFLTVIPTLLPRTIAGIPEKESAAFLFIFLSYYFIVKSFKSKNKINLIINSLLGGIFTGILGLIWGGVGFVLISVELAFLGAYFLGTINKKRLLAYFLWVVAFSFVLKMFGTRFSIIALATSISTAPILFGLVLGAIDIYFYKQIKEKKFMKYLKEKLRLTRELSVFVIVVVFFSILLAIYTIAINPGFLSQKITSFYDQVIRPLGSTRFTRTVAENRQTFFVGEWKGSFGPLYNNIPLFFWLFMVGSLTLFFNMVKKLKKKHAIGLSLSFGAFIFAMVFSRYSPSSSLNGTSTFSIIFYLVGLLIFLATVIYMLNKYRDEYGRDLLKFDFSILMLISMFVISLLAARSGVRFMMVLAPPASILVGYLIIVSFKKAHSEKREIMKLILWGLFLLILLASIYVGMQYYNTSKAQANNFHPSSYQFQWQKAMDWVRTNTSEDAVFSHWWDYGYWIQSIGNRATVLDGGNVIVYWNHLLGRHVLTGSDEGKALEFLKTHEATHLLIDSTDIGKYSAFSSIAGDENNDRFSYIPSFFLDPRGTQETKEGSTYIYSGGTNLDEDIIFYENGTEIRLASENSGLGAILIKSDTDGNLLQPSGIYVSAGRQIEIPFKYLYFNHELKEFDSGIEAGVFVMETLTPEGNTIVKNDKGALMYLSKRTVNSLLVRNYLFEEEGNFKLVHSQPMIITEDLRNQGFETDDFAYFQGNFLGPIIATP